MLALAQSSSQTLTEQTVSAAETDTNSGQKAYQITLHPIDGLLLNRGQSTLIGEVKATGPRNAIYEQLVACNGADNVSFSAEMEEIDLEDHDNKYIINLAMLGVTTEHGIPAPEDHLAECFSIKHLSIQYNTFEMLFSGGQGIKVSPVTTTRDKIVAGVSAIAVALVLSIAVMLNGQSGNLWSWGTVAGVACMTALWFYNPITVHGYLPRYYAIKFHSWFMSLFMLTSFLGIMSVRESIGNGIAVACLILVILFIGGSTLDLVMFVTLRYEPTEIHTGLRSRLSKRTGETRHDI